MIPNLTETPPKELGDIFQETVATWLSRQTPEIAQNHCLDVSVVLASDIGLRRQENQDRVAVLRSSSRHNDRQSIVAVAIADGMGGMKDGARCATLAVAAFFRALIFHGSSGIEPPAHEAVACANDAVYAYAGGRGGTTLSALVFRPNEPAVIVHVGDSRIYSYGPESKLERLTVDDSLGELFGGDSRELFQFVGMGASLQPYVGALPPTVGELALTTDGIHDVAPQTFESILFHASGPKTAVEKLVAMARRTGGNDNASLALIDIKALSSTDPKSQAEGVQIWDPFGTLSLPSFRGDSDDQFVT
jgi:PPM family protein phosphatase